MARNGRDGAVGLWLMDDHVGAVFGHDRVSAVSEWLRSHRVGSRTECISSSGVLTWKLMSPCFSRSTASRRLYLVALNQSRRKVFELGSTSQLSEVMYLVKAVLIVRAVPVGTRKCM